MADTINANVPQFGRVASLIITSSATGNGLEISDLHFRFQTFQHDDESPNKAIIRVWNPSPNTANSIVNEFDRIVIQAGYKTAGASQIFAGTVVQVERGRESAVDNYLEITAADGDFPYNYGILNQTIGADGTTPNALDVVKRMSVALGLGIGDGVSDALSLANGPTGGIFPRGKVAFGLARKHFRTISDTVQARWSVQAGKLTMVKLSGYLPGDAVVLTPTTGLVGSAASTLEGIRARCLLNPLIVPGRRIQLDQSFINTTNIASNYDTSSYAQKPRYATISPDGDYRTLVVEHQGDTRGQEWYTDITCLAVDPSAPADSSVKVG